MRDRNSDPSLLANQSALRTEFGDALVKLGERDRRLIVLDADVAGGTGTAKFREKFSDRFIQVGIAEQNLIGVAAGLASEGWKPVVASFSAFLLRAVDQIRISLAYSGRAVTIVSSHSGLDVGPDGASAQCLEDLAIFRSIPLMNVFVPSSPLQLGPILSFSTNAEGPTYIRTGRSPIRTVVGQQTTSSTSSILHLDGTDVTLVACGPMVYRCIEAANQLSLLGISARVIEIVQIKPLHTTLLIDALQDTKLLFSVEDHSQIGGLGSAILETAGSGDYGKIVRIGTPDVFGHSGDPDTLYRYFELDTPSLVKTICAHLEKLESALG